MRKTLLLLCFGLLTSLLWGQNNITASSSTCGTNDSSTSSACVVLPINNASGTGTVSIIGTYSGTLQFETSVDGGASWVAIQGTPPGSSSAVTSTTSTGTWVFRVSASSFLRVRCSSYVSGTATVTMKQSPASASLGSGGGVGSSSSGDALVNSSGSVAGVSPGADGACMVSSSGAWIRASCAGSTSTNFSSLTADAPNTSAGTFQIGNGTTLTTTGTGSIIATTATKLAAARTLAGNSFDGSANIQFTNKFIVQGTSDSGLSAAQFLGALGTGLVKNTTTTGVLSIAASGTDYAPATSGSVPLKGNGSGGFSAATGADIVALWASGSCSGFLKADLTCASTVGNVTVVGGGSLTSTALVTGGGTTTLQTAAPTATMDSSGNISTPGILTSTAANSGLDNTEGTGAALTAASGHDLLFASSSAHRWVANNNNAGNVNVAVWSDAITSFTGTIAADTIVMNATAGVAAPTAASISSCGDSTHALSYTSHAWGCQAITATATAGGSNTQLQYNNSTSLGGVSSWTTNGSTTLTGGSGAIFDLSAGSSTVGFKPPSAAGAVPTAAGVLSYDSTANQPVFGDGTNTVRMIGLSGSTPANNDCAKFVVSGTSVKVATNGGACGAGGSGTTVTVNGSATSSTANLSSTLPAIVTNKQTPASFQQDAVNPNNIGAYVTNVRRNAASRRHFECWANGTSTPNCLGGDAAADTGGTKTLVAGTATNSPMVKWTGPGGASQFQGLSGDATNSAWRFGTNLYLITLSYSEDVGSAAIRYWPAVIHDNGSNSVLNGCTPSVNVAGFRYCNDGTTTDAHIMCYLSKSGVGTTATDSTVSPSTTTLQVYEVVMDDTNSITHFYINGTEVCAGMSMTNRPTSSTNAARWVSTNVETAATVIHDNIASIAMSADAGR
jgi:hypothetical protein